MSDKNSNFYTQGAQGEMGSRIRLKGVPSRELVQGCPRVIAMLRIKASAPLLNPILWLKMASTCSKLQLLSSYGKTLQ